MLIIGILGGVASGKSLVTQQFARLGAATVDADRIGHDVLLDPSVESAVRSRWGSKVFDPNQRIDRKAVAHIVFGPPPQGPEELAFLEQLTHPLIGQHIQQSIQDLKHKELSGAGNHIVILDAPVMRKAGWHKYCDRIVFVDADRQTRLERVRQRGWSEAQFDARENSQESLNDKCRHADCVIDNSGSPDDTFAQVQQFWNSLGLST